MVEQYIVARSLDEALAALNTNNRLKAVIAGGTDLLLDIQQGRHSDPDILLDVSEIAEMRQISTQGKSIYLGAAVTHNEIVRSDLLKEHAACLVEGCGLIGGPQVRNVATIGGNVAHALPAGDGTIALLALDAEVNITSITGESRWEPLEELFAGPGKVSFDRQRELLIGFRFACKKGIENSAFQRVMRPQGVAIAILNMAAWLRLDANRYIEAVRLACGPAGPRPFRAHQTEAVLKGKRFDEQLLVQVSNTLANEVRLRTSRHRATQEYRQQLLPYLLGEVLQTAIAGCE
jgi:CO/xanthine dehydrogenase FAD-binding subunit